MTHSKRVLHYKKPGFWILLAAVAACVAAAVCFLTDPKDDTQPLYSDRVLCVAVRNSEGSVLEEDAKWYYYNLREGERVTLPGNTEPEILVESVDKGIATLKFSTPLRQEGMQVWELELGPGDSAELYAGDPGGSTQYTLLNMIRPTNTKGAVFSWIESDRDVREEQTVIMAYFPGVTFHYTKSSVWAEGNGMERWEMFEGMPIQNVHFADLSGDGLPEVCATVNWGSGVIDTYVAVADFVERELFYIRDRGVYDYYLTNESGKLVCTVTNYNDTAPLECGQLTLVQAAGGSGRKLLLVEETTKEDPTEEEQDGTLDESDETGVSAGRIQQLLNIIASEPLPSSAPGDYIKAHAKEYEELVSYGELTLRHCFEKFLKGGQSDLQGHIMATACEQIMESWSETYEIPPMNRMTGQNWFDSFRTQAQRLGNQYDRGELEKRFPGAAIVLEYLG